jgi:hypothetical protein
VVPLHTPCRRLVVQTRLFRFPFRANANRVVRLVNGKPKEKRTDDPGGAGSQIVREVIACPRCANGQEAAHA